MSPNSIEDGKVNEEDETYTIKPDLGLGSFDVEVEVEEGTVTGYVNGREYFSDDYDDQVSREEAAQLARDNLMAEFDVRAALQEDDSENSGPQTFTVSPYSQDVEIEIYENGSYPNGELNELERGIIGRINGREVFSLERPEDERIPTMEELDELARTELAKNWELNRDVLDD